MNAWIESREQDALAAVVAESGELFKETYQTDDVHFAIWLAYVDRRFRLRFGVSLMDVEDWTWRYAYDSNMTPAEASESAAEDLMYDYYG